METLKIDKAYPMRHSVTATMAALEIGDSFLLPGRNRYVSVMPKRLGIKITIRKTDEGFRVWRIA